MDSTKDALYWLKQILVVLLGNAIYALTVIVFLLPSGLPTGGTTGLALVTNLLFNMPISEFILGFNTLMFLLGWKILGKAFAFNTALSTFSYPLFLSLFERLMPNAAVTQDLFLCTVFSGLGIGAALGLVIRTGASTGGMDIPPLIMFSYFRFSVSATMYIFDCIILLLQAFNGSLEKLLYGIILIIIYTVVLDKALLLGTSRTEVKIISRRHKEIADAILTEIDRGVTLVKAEGGYEHKATDLVLSIMSSRELPRVERLVHKIDPECFMIINRINEVSGRGFTMLKDYR